MHASRQACRMDIRHDGRLVENSLGGFHPMSEKTTIYLPEKIKKAIKIYVINEDLPSMNEFILEACMEKLEKEGICIKS